MIHTILSDDLSHVYAKDKSFKMMISGAESEALYGEKRLKL